MKLVRERQMEEHRRRLDELRQAQMQAMKAKQQQEDERRRRLEEIKNRDDSRRAAVEARRKRIEDEERVSAPTDLIFGWEFFLFASCISKVMSVALFGGLSWRDFLVACFVCWA